MLKKVKELIKDLINFPKSVFYILFNSFISSILLGMMFFVTVILFYIASKG